MRKKSIAVFMTICLLLTGCQGNVNKTEQKEEKQETADAAQAEIQCEYEWATSHCTYRTEEMGLSDGADGEDEEDICQECLVQSDYEGKVIQKIPAGRLGLRDTQGIYFMHVSENEVLISSTSDSSDLVKVYSVPVIRKGDREEIAIEKIQQLFVEFADFQMDCKYITDTKEYILFNWEGEMAEYDRKKNKFTRIKYKNKPLEVGSILYENNKDFVVLYGFLGDETAVYYYNFVTKKMQEITKDERSIYQGGDDKLFYTAVKGEKSGLCYDVYQFDCKSGEKSVLVTEEQIRNALSEKPEEGMDLIREIGYEDGTLKLAINVKGKCVLLACDTKTGKLVQEGEGKLQKTQEYLQEKPLTNADKNYANANDYNVFVQRLENDMNYVLDEYTLDGTFVRHIFTNNFHCTNQTWKLLYANNQELIFYVEDYDLGNYLYTVPLMLADGSSFPQMEKAKKICKCNKELEEPRQGDLYADSDYIVYQDGMYQIHVYDRKKKTFVKIKGIPESNMYLNGLVGKYFILSSKPYKEKGKEKYAFSYYKIGSDQIHIMDPACYTSAAAIGDKKRKQVIYALRTGIWTYDLKQDKKKRLVKWNKKDYVSEMCIRKNRLFVFTGEKDEVYSYSLTGKEKQLHYEKEFTEILKKYEQENDLELVIDSVDVVNNKICIHSWQDDEYLIYLCYDPATKQLKKVRKSDPEMLYFLLCRDGASVDEWDRDE